MFTTCIVGTGFAGTCALWHWVKALGHLENRAPVKIITIEKSRCNGAGFPYSEQNTLLSHLCNNPAKSMAIEGNDFVVWMQENSVRLFNEHAEMIRQTHRGVTLENWEPDGEAFYPRALFGLYLQERFEEAVHQAKILGIKFEQYNGYEVQSGQRVGNTFQLSLRHTQTEDCLDLEQLDKVLLATGHWQLPNASALGPYPPKLIKAMAAKFNEEQYSVVGMGPSGVDSIFTLFDQGQFIFDDLGKPIDYHFKGGRFTVLASSRSGYFPAVRQPLLDLDYQYLTDDAIEVLKQKNGGKLLFNDFLHLVDQELKHASSGVFSWQNIQSPSYRSAFEKMTADLEGKNWSNLAYTVILRARRMKFYRALAPREKAFYDQNFDSYFIRTAVPLPRENAEKLHLLMRLGYLKTKAIGFDAKSAEPIESSVITVKAAGQNFDIAQHPSAFIQDLLKKGEIIPYEQGGFRTGGIWVDTSNGYRVFQNSHSGIKSSPVLFSYGALIQAWQNEHNYAAAFVVAAQSVVADWLESLEQLKASDLGMSFQEFDFENNVRICVYNVGKENLPFHKHQHISDITYCDQGQITIEMLDTKTSVVLKAGDFFQVPKGESHRCYHSSPSDEKSRYVLVQFGQFDIEFKSVENKSIPSFSLQDNPKNVCQFSGYESDLAKARDWFSQYKGKKASLDEIHSIQAGLNRMMRGAA